ncbi:MAG: alpha/beta fold hydrolase [Bacteroidia bacterium]
MRLNFKKYGQDGPVLIILHGLFGSLDNWHTLAGRFAEDFCVFTVDQRNHGKSPHSDHHNYRLMAKDLAEFMEQHELKTAAVLGHSMGGKTAMQFAMQFPEKVEMLLVADMAPKAYDPHHDSIIEALENLDLDKVNKRNEADEQLAQYIKSEGVRLFLLKNLARKENGGYRWKMNLPVISDHYEEISAALEAGKPFEKPALFIRGENSNYILEEDQPDIRKIFPAALFATVKDAGHWLHADQPDTFYSIVKTFIEQKQA